MSSNIKYLAAFTIFSLFFFGAARCGTAQYGAEAPAGTAGAANEAQEQVIEGEYELEPANLGSIDLAEGEKLKVVATTSIVADIVKNVGGHLIEASLLLPVGTDPHAFEPTPRDLAMVADADVVFANGMGLEAFLTGMLKNAGGDAALVEVSQGIEPRQMGQTEVHEHEAEEGHSEEQEHDHEGRDPHTWTTPANGIIFVHNIEQALSALDPGHSEAYRANATAYELELEQLDEWTQAQINTIPAENRELVTDHAIFGYYADRYGLEQVGAVIPSFSSAAEPSAQEIAQLADAIEAYGVKAIFVGASVNPRLSQRLAEDTGTKLLALYTGSLGPPGSGVETYEDYIKYNTNTIVEGLR